MGRTFPVTTPRIQRETANSIRGGPCVRSRRRRHRTPNHFHGVGLAWKRTYTRVIGERQLNEMKILRQMRREKHQHIVELVGSYVRRAGKAGGIHELGLLIWPVAYCDLGTLLLELDKMNNLLSRLFVSPNDRESIESTNFLAGLMRKNPSRPRGETCRDSLKRFSRAIGCIAHALEFLHAKGIRHRDLKPDQILISRDGLWVTDFGWSKDISNLSTSVSANGETINRKYISPERAQTQPTGWSEDIFALGCTYLQMAYVLTNLPLQQLEDLRTCADRSFQANLENLGKWVAPLRLKSKRFLVLAFLIEQTLISEPDRRPKAREVVAILEACNNMSLSSWDCQIFGDCCSDTSMPTTYSGDLLEVLERTVGGDNNLNTYDAAWEILHRQYRLSCRAVEKLQDTLCRNDLEIGDLGVKMHDLEASTQKQIEDLQEQLRASKAQQAHTSEMHKIKRDHDDKTKSMMEQYDAQIESWRERIFGPQQSAAASLD
ncbi:kinase-like protein [Mytilinidion resinicola]|uniref:non-specific serine/threonine protein kinase n=1 Tax=Mytilinidion resinicola TaxID=574789 RepID=A0A6A6YCT8_9PEZI|nr:kinase-like protein [Mytilinidion resinicola]KAF2805834.1 kinase-like protein [Mytilinidion resinicola]